MKTNSDGGFTRVDLVAVIAMVALLALLAVPAIGQAAAVDADAGCINNMRQLLRAVHLYTADYADYLPPMGTSGGAPPNSNLNWLITNNDAPAVPVSFPAAWRDPAYNMLAPYMSGGISPTTNIFKCPADPTTVLVGAQRVPAPRSVSMSQAVGTNPMVPGGKTATDGMWLDSTQPHTANRTFRTYARLSDVVNPRPSNLFIFLDEAPESIGDAGFGCMGPTLTGRGYTWIDFPATYHNKGGGFGFADGHGEIHIWVDPGTVAKPPTFSNAQNDLHWLATHVTARIGDDRQAP